MTGDQSPTQSPFVVIFEHHKWSNLTMIDFCSSLTDEQLGLTVPGVFGGVLATIRHIIANEVHYLNFLGDCAKVEAYHQRGDFSGWAHTHLTADATGDALIAFVSQLQDDHLQPGSFDGEQFEVPTSHFLGQIINHATEHRSHLRTQLSAHGITPPEIDIWHYQDWLKETQGWDPDPAMR